MSDNDGGYGDDVELKGQDFEGDTLVRLSQGSPSFTRYNPKAPGEYIDDHAGQIAKSCQAVRDALDALDKAIKVNGNLISPILVADLTKRDDEPKRSGDDVDVRSKIAQEFDNLAARVRTATNKLNDINDRVDL